MTNTEYFDPGLDGRANSSPRKYSQGIPLKAVGCVRDQTILKR